MPSGMQYQHLICVFSCSDLVQHPNQPLPMAAEATDEDDEETHALHHTHPPGYGGCAPRRELLVLDFPVSF